MRYIPLLLIIALISCKGQNTESMKHKFTNDLINETSPYLLQHAHNPVNWNAWNDNTLAQAKQENKLIIISVGYAACHWCHQRNGLMCNLLGLWNYSAIFGLKCFHKVQ